MAEDALFEDVLAQLRQRDEKAAAQVFNRFGSRLISLARSRLDPRLQGKLDPEDVVQSVFRTVFRRLRQGEFDLGGWDSFWGLLTRITVRKCGKWSHYYHAAGRNVILEQAPGGGTDASSESWQFLDREPAPEEVMELAEAVQSVLRGLDSREEQIVSLRLQGYRAVEISDQLGCTESKVYRVLRLIRQRLERMRDELDA